MSKLTEEAALFVILGFTSFGGPAAHTAIMHDEAVKRLVNLGRYYDAKALYESEIKEQANLNFGLCESLAKDPGYSVEFNYDYTRIHQILCEP